MACCATTQAAGLPDPEMARAALWASPGVEMARAELDAQAYSSRALSRGQGEWTLSGDLAQRRVESLPDAPFTEWGASIMRPVRLPARANADRKLADASLDLARASLGEALHEAGRELLRLWFDWQGAQTEQLGWAAQRTLAEQQRASVEKRIRLGESARSEGIAMDALLAQTQLQADIAAQRNARTRNQLQAAFPALVLPPDAPLPRPEAMPGEARDWIEKTLAHNHELARARAEAQVRSQTVLQLASRRHPDPSVGLFYKNEAGNREHVIGVNLGFTLPGATRSLDEAAAQRRADAASHAAMRLEKRLIAEVQLNYLEASNAYLIWQQADTATRTQETAARLAARAFELGEGDLASVMSSRRLAIESRLAETAQRRNAHAARARLELDAHTLWPLDVDTDEHHPHP
jgi:outer membrane protein TolC